jgi:hypothetical protein
MKVSPAPSWALRRIARAAPLSVKRMATSGKAGSAVP